MAWRVTIYSTSCGKLRISVAHVMSCRWSLCFLTCLTSRLLVARQLKRNTDTVDLNGDSGNDTFVVRSFIALVIDANGEILGSDSKKVTAFGGDDEDNFEVKREAPKNENEPDQELFKSRGEDPDYVVNSLVSSSCCLQPSICFEIFLSP